MMSRKLTVMVRDAAAVIDGPLEDRPVRQLPSGTAGVVYLGHVYPLYAGDYIDITDTPLDKDQCQRFVGLNAPIVYNQRARVTPAPKRYHPKRWYVESNRFGHYVVFDGTEAQAADLADQLATSPAGLIRWGESTRQADDGHHYDWFARLEFTGTRDQCLTALQPILGTLPLSSVAISSPSAGATTTTATGRHPASPEATTAPVTDISAVLLRALRAEREVDRLTAAAGTHAQAYADLQAQAKTAHTKLAEAAARLRDTEHLLAERDDLRKRVVADTQLIRQVTAERDATTARARKTNTELTQRLRAAQSELEDMRRDQADLERSLAKARAERDHPSAGRPPAADRATELERENASLTKRISDQSRTISELERIFDEELVPRTDLLQAQKRLQETTAELDAAQESLRDAQRLADDRQAINGRLQDQLTEARQELADRDRQERRARTNGSRLDDLIGSLFPHLHLDPDSIDQIETQFPDPRDLFDVLKRLDIKAEMPLKATSFPGVKEVDKHIATGDPSCGSLGRVYTRPLADGRLWVRIHRKRDSSEQSRVLKNFAERNQPASHAA